MSRAPVLAAIVCTAVWVAGGWVAVKVAQWVTGGGLADLSDQGAAMVAVVAVGLFCIAAAVVSLIGDRR